MQCCCRVVLVLLCVSAFTLNSAKADEWMDHLCTYFDIVDYNKDLDAYFTDFVEVWLRVPLIESGSGEELIIDVQRQIDLAIQFFQLFPMTDKSLAPSILSGGVTLKEYIQTMANKRYGSLLKNQIFNLMAFIMKVFNYDGDNQSLTPRELGIVYQVFRIDKSALSDSFTAMDANNDGNISLAEGNYTAVQYFVFAPDDSSRLWAGPVRPCAEVAKNSPSLLASLGPVVPGSSGMAPGSRGSSGSSSDPIQF